MQFLYQVLKDIAEADKSGRRLQYAGSFEVDLEYRLFYISISRDSWKIFTLGVPL